MDSILSVLASSWESILLPVLKVAWLVVLCGLWMAVIGTAICRDEVKAALRMADISQKEAALTMGISTGLLSHKLSGEKPLTLESLAPLPERFWQFLALNLVHRYGLPPVIQTATAITHHNETEGVR